ncbi:branched-chain amino acid transaminase [Streptomyces sp. SID3343]|uniref:branched-chain amino acid transaminase n=1 Tax=Streptomyces sp. SID3343 TaxID=2690260 RepID=UPI00136CC698|nr:branched-chain amino acid transaminase [Streptomyces sp. SID3343]MYV97859.1 branched-chain amino acid transaminase [Streptomyces sp. SID3343]
MALTEADWIWMDGALAPWREAKVHVLTHALHYGTGVIEGTRAHGTPRGPAVFRLDDHLRRLRESAHILGFAIPYDSAALRTATLDLIAANGHESCYLRHVAHLGYGEMGPIIQPAADVGVFVAGWEWGAYLGADAADRGIRLATSSWRRNDPNVLPPAAKATAGYLNAALAKTAAVRAGYDEALLLSGDGYVSECSAANVFAVRGGVLYTPPAASGALRGITQDTVLTLAADLGIPVRVENLLRSDLYTADEVLISGTAVDIVPVASLDDREVGTGLITRKLQAAYAAAVTGADERYAHWLTYVRR